MSRTLLAPTFSSARPSATSDAAAPVGWPPGQDGDATGDHDGQLIPVLAAAVRIACRRMTALQLKALHDSVEQAWRTPAAFGWDRKAAAHAEVFNLLAAAASDPLAPVLRSGAGLSYDLMVGTGRAVDGMITSSRQRLLTHLRVGDADAAELEIESHLRVLHYMWRLARPVPPRVMPYSTSCLDGRAGGRSGAADRAQRDGTGGERWQS